MISLVRIVAVAPPFVLAEGEVVSTEFFSPGFEYAIPETHLHFIAGVRIHESTGDAIHYRLTDDDQ